MENIFSDIANAAKLTAQVRRERKEGSPARLAKVYRVPVVDFGYWGFTPEACLFYGEKWSPVRDVFHGFPEGVQRALTFTPEDGEWTSRVELWEKPLRKALPLDAYMEAMAILCDWVLRCMKRREEELGAEEVNTDE